MEEYLLAAILVVLIVRDIPTMYGWWHRIQHQRKLRRR